MEETKDAMHTNPDSDESRSSSPPPSPLSADELFFNRLLSRNSTDSGHSSRFYCRAAGQVPFEWEAQPGRPKNSTESEPLPLLSPPPAMHSAWLAQHGDLSAARRSVRNKRRRHAAPPSKCVLSNGDSTSSMAQAYQGCFVRPLKLTISGAVKRWEFPRTLLSMFGKA